eukprot:scaffold3953_cov169-Amphora_coffeaeformis.AAC.7
MHKTECASQRGELTRVPEPRPAVGKEAVVIPAKGPPQLALRKARRSNRQQPFTAATKEGKMQMRTSSSLFRPVQYDEEPKRFFKPFERVRGFGS